MTTTVRYALEARRTLLPTCRGRRTRGRDRMRSRLMLAVSCVCGTLSLGAVAASAAASRGSQGTTRITCHAKLTDMAPAGATSGTELGLMRCGHGLGGGVNFIKFKVRSTSQTTLALRPVVYLGELCYSYYMLHSLVLTTWLVKRYKVSGQTWPAGVQLATLGVISLAAAAACAHGCEAPAQRWFRRRCRPVVRSECVPVERRMAA